jgi:hypothetical protein
MADTKISALTGASTPLAGTEVVPIVQGGSTVKVAVSNLTSGRAVDALSFASTTGANFATTSGSVGIGTSSPSSLLHLMTTTNAGSGPTQKFELNDTGTSIAIGQNLGDLQFIGNDGQGSGIRAQIIAITEGASGDTGLSFLTGAATVAAVENLRISSIGNVTVNTGNLVIGTSGKGIDFTATSNSSGTMTSELLADYEEGTFTPVYTPATGAFTSITLTASGRYRKIGSTVFFWIDTRTTAATVLGTASGILYITGLPFTNGASSGYGTCATFQQFNLGTSFTNLGVTVEASQSRLFLTKNSSNTSVTYVQATELNTGVGSFNNLLGISGSYTV